MKASKEADKRIVKDGNAKRFIKKLNGDEKLRVRFIPSTLPNGSIFYPRCGHFGVKVEGRLRFAECLRAEGEKKCPGCETYFLLKDSDDDGLKKKAPQFRPQNHYYAAFYVRGKESDGVRVLNFKETLRNAVINLAEDLIDTDQLPFWGDAEGKGGQDVFLKRTGSGFDDTEYFATLVPGSTSDLDAVYPGWREEEFDLAETCGMTLLPYDDFRAAILEYCTSEGIALEEIEAGAAQEEIPF